MCEGFLISFFTPFSEPITGNGTQHSWSSNGPTGSDNTFARGIKKKKTNKTKHHPSDEWLKANTAITPVFSRFPARRRAATTTDCCFSLKMPFLRSGKLVLHDMIHELHESGRFFWRWVEFSTLIKRPTPCARTSTSHLDGWDVLQSTSFAAFFFFNIVSYSARRAVLDIVALFFFIHKRVIKTCCQELIALASHRNDERPSRLSRILLKKKKKGLVMMGLARMRAETETMQEDIRGFSLASLAQITAWRSLFEGGICNARQGRICSRWPSLHLFHTSESLWSPKMLHKEEAVSAKKDGSESGRASLTILSSHIENGRLGLLMTNKLCQELWCEEKKKFCFGSSGSDHTARPNVHLPSKRTIWPLKADGSFMPKLNRLASYLACQAFEPIMSNMECSTVSADGRPKEIMSNSWKNCWTIGERSRQKATFTISFVLRRLGMKRRLK